MQAVMWWIQEKMQSTPEEVASYYMKMMSLELE
jgi:hypothetical protein